MANNSEGSSSQAPGPGRPTRTLSTRSRYRQASTPYQQPSQIGLGHPSSNPSFPSAPQPLDPIASTSTPATSIAPAPATVPVTIQPNPAANQQTIYQEASRPLQRGGACLPCRRRRAKCNGAKPTCERCMITQQLGRECNCIYELAQPKVCCCLVVLRLGTTDSDLSFSFTGL